MADSKVNDRSGTQVPNLGSWVAAQPGLRENQGINSSAEAKCRDAPVAPLSTHSTIDCRHVAGIGVNVGRCDGKLRLRDQLLVVVCLQVPDVDSTALVTHDEFCLGCS